jgi:hypothetical protein
LRVSIITNKLHPILNWNCLLWSRFGVIHTLLSFLYSCQTMSISLLISHN